MTNNEEGYECSFGRYVELRMCDILYSNTAGLTCC